MTNPDISIVTPVFNSVRWIELCLQSVRHALQGQSYEHIVVDGVSTDGTLEYLKQQKISASFQGQTRECTMP